MSKHFLLISLLFVVISFLTKNEIAHLVLYILSMLSFLVYLINHKLNVAKVRADHNFTIAMILAATVSLATNIYLLIIELL